MTLRRLPHSSTKGPPQDCSWAILPVRLRAVAAAEPGRLPKLSLSPQLAPTRATLRRTSAVCASACWQGTSVYCLLVCAGPLKLRPRRSGGGLPP